MMPDRNEAESPAGLVRRVAALMYDGVVVLAVVFAAALPFVVLVGEARTPVTRLLFQLYLLGVVYAFFAWFWRHGGQTVGMRAWRIRVVAADGLPLTWRQTALRFAAALISLLCLGLGWWWILIDEQKRSWHDRLSRTRVVRG